MGRRKAYKKSSYCYENKGYCFLNWDNFITNDLIVGKFDYDSINDSDSDDKYSVMLKNTKLRLSNQIGIIDENYRGEIMALVDNFDNEDFVIKKDERLFQLVFPSLKPFKIELVDDIDESDRGSNGFGSTGTGTNNI